MKAYIRLDPLMDERKGHYSPAQFGALVKVLCLASRQKERGRFRSQQALANLMPRAYERLLAFLYEEGDIVLDDDGTVAVDGWEEWQEGDLTVAERMSRLRNRTGERHERRGMPKDRSPGAKRTAAWRLRTQVFERDAYTCRYCGVTDYPRGYLVTDHVIPQPEGPTTLDNLVTACRPCNKKKGGRTPEQANMPVRDVSVTRHVTGVTPYRTATRIDVDVDVGLDGESIDSPLAREDDVVSAYNEATLRTPQGWVLDRLNELARAFGEKPAAEAVRRACAEHVGDKPSIQLNAAETILLVAQRERQKAAEERRKRAAIDEQRDLAKRIESASPEERERAERVKRSIGALVEGFRS